MSSVRALDHYVRVSSRAAAAVIRGYSSSFSLATALLGKPVRGHISNLYAMVRVADEVVDGTATGAGLDAAAVREQLDAFEQEVLDTAERGFSTNPVVQAFSHTYRQCGLRREDVQAFFRSMRADITKSTYSDQGLEQYIYGSAEVIGLMCLDIFLTGRPLPPAEYQRAQHGARALGAAFQKINFLRDFREDSQELGRAYYGGAGGTLSDAEKDRVVADIRADLSTAYSTMGLLPGRCRTGVLAAYLLFEELTDKAASLPAARLGVQRISVPRHRKALLAAKAARLAPTMS